MRLPACAAGRQLHGLLPAATGWARVPQHACRPLAPCSVEAQRKWLHHSLRTLHKVAMGMALQALGGTGAARGTAACAASPQRPRPCLYAACHIRPHATGSCTAITTIRQACVCAAMLGNSVQPHSLKGLWMSRGHKAWQGCASHEAHRTRTAARGAPGAGQPAGRSAGPTTWPVGFTPFSSWTAPAAAPCCRIARGVASLAPTSTPCRP